MTDDEFLRAFFACALKNSEFRHRDHLRLAWLVITRHGLGTAMDVIPRGIQRFAQSRGHAALYHQTMTVFWLRLVAHAVDNQPQIDRFEDFLEAYPLLLDPGLPYKHWSRQAMFSDEARTGWKEPDLAALPF
ncbi:MAG TPA: hypothetical protein VF134_01320 [Candidatus Dormibacteraeota bacterium]